MTPRGQAGDRPVGGASSWGQLRNAGREDRSWEGGRPRPAICRDRSLPPLPLRHPCRRGYKRGVQGCWPGEPSCPFFPFSDPYTVLATGQSW